MSSVAKGSRHEREAATYARSLGYQVYNPPSVRFQKQDIFGFGDLFLANRFEVILVQVKSDRRSSHWAWKEVARLAKAVPDGLMIRELWVRKDGGEFERYQFDGEKFIPI